MKYERYKRIDNAIKASDNGGAWERWRYGRRLLCDRTMTNENGNLYNGRLEWLARRSGVSEREIKLRLQAARTYPQESQIRRAIAQFGSWTGLQRARFPEIPATDGELPYNPLETDELLRQQKAASDRATEDSLYEGGGLFPREYDDSTRMRELVRYVEVRLELAARFSGDAFKLKDRVDELLKAVHGNLDATLGEAKRALYGDGD